MRFKVLDVEIDALRLADAVSILQESIRKSAKISVVFCTVSTLLEVRKDNELRAALARADLVTPDGMPLVWIGRWSQPDPISRVYGPDLLREFLRVDGGNSRHFFYGSTATTVRKMTERLKATYPGIQIVGALSPGFGDIDRNSRRDIETINKAAPDVVWVGLGHPKQERWMHNHRDALSAPVLAGVGAAFDFLAGEKKEAPLWMRKGGIQWLHRLASEPTRLWRRYVLGNSTFVLLLMKEWIGHVVRRTPKSQR